MKLNKIYLAITLLLLLPCRLMAQFTSVNEKVAVLITGWGPSAGYNFEYAWNSHRWCRVGDKTEYVGQPCKIGHVGDFPYQLHLGLVPWALHTETEGWEASYDNNGIYIDDSSNNRIFGNTITDNYDFGINHYRSSGDTIYQNILANNVKGIRLSFSDNNRIFLNNMTCNDYGLDIGTSSNNLIFENVIANNDIGVP